MTKKDILALVAANKAGTLSDEELASTLGKVSATPTTLYINDKGSVVWRSGCRRWPMGFNAGELFKLATGAFADILNTASDNIDSLEFTSKIDPEKDADGYARDIAEKRVALEEAIEDYFVKVG